MSKKKAAAKDLNDLKQELEIDDHKIPIEELYQRLGTNPETVSNKSIKKRNKSAFHSYVIRRLCRYSVLFFLPPTLGRPSSRPSIRPSILFFPPP